MSFLEAGAGGLADIMNASTNALVALTGTDKDVNMQGSGTVKTTSTQDSNQLIKALQSLMQSESQQGTTTQLAAADQERIRALLGNLTGQLLGTQPSQIDFDAVRKSAISQVLEAGMGDVIASASNARAYASTPQATAAERLSSRAAIEGTQAQTNAKLQEQQQLQNTIGALLAILKGAESSVDLTNTTTGTTSSESSANTKVTGTEDTKSTQLNQTQQDEEGLGESFAGGLGNLGKSLIGGIKDVFKF